MAITGDIKENYILLQNSTGESFAHMADRLTSPEVFGGLDENGRAANQELADWLRKQDDDMEAVERKTNPDAPTVAAQKRQDQAKSDQHARDNAPRNRNVSGGRQNG